MADIYDTFTLEDAYAFYSEGICLMLNDGHVTDLVLEQPYDREEVKPA